VIMATNQRQDRHRSAGREDVIAVRGLEKRYGDRVVLRGVDLTVTRGEVLCILGPNGAGKTTTVEILEGLRTADDGVVRVLGFDPAEHAKALRERTGVVLQDCGFPNRYRVRELIDTWRHYFPTPKPLDELLELVELQDEADRLVRQLSGGQRRRLDFALALAGDPELLFLDEPTTGFDPEARQRCWTAIDNLRALEKTILLTTHYLEEAERLADRVAILSRGRVHAVGSPGEVAKDAGGRTRITFRIGDRARDLLAGAPVPIRMAGQWATAETTDAATTLRALLTWADDANIALDDLSVEPARLEDVYLQLVHDDAETA